MSITTVRFDEYFGFTDDEVKDMLEYYGLENRCSVMQDWYDGYRFGNVDVYCPWDVINYCDDLLDDPDALPRDYWSNTSSNDIVRRFIERVDSGLTRSEIEALVAGETVTKEIREDLTYNRLYDSIDNIWSVLFTTGYLTQRGKPEGRRYRLAIPNMEIRNIFTDQIMAMFKEEVSKDGELLGMFCEALQNGDATEVERSKELKEDGCHTIYKYGIVCYKKKCRVAVEREDGMSGESEYTSPRLHTWHHHTTPCP